MEVILVLFVIFFVILIFYMVGEAYAYSKENGVKLDKILQLLETGNHETGKDETGKNESSNNENSNPENMNSINENVNQNIP